MWRHPIFIINLPSRPDRRASARQQLSSLHLEATFVDAIDGRSGLEAASNFVDQRGRLSRAPRPLGPGEIGCYLSHWKIFENMVAQNIPKALILEDDFIATETLPEVLAGLDDTKCPPYDIVKLGIGEVCNKKSFSIISDISGKADLVRHHNVCNGTVAYVITKEGAARFLKYGRPIRYPIDVALNRFWRHRMNVLGVRPWPVIHDLESPTSIGTERFAGDKDRSRLLVRVERRIRRGFDSIAKRVVYMQRRAGDRALRKST